MKIKVAYDFKLFTLQRYGGISRYFYNLVDQLSNLDEFYPKIFSPVHNNFYINNLKSFNRYGLYLPSLYPKITRLSDVINKILTHYPLKNFKPNIVHETYYSQNLLIKHDIPRILTVYDFINEIYPMDFNTFLSDTSNRNIDLLLVPLLSSKFNDYRSPVKFFDAARLNAAGIYSKREPYLNFINNNIDGILLNNDQSKWLYTINYLLDNEYKLENLKTFCKKRVIEYL